jgi:hypothetical protein
MIGFAATPVTSVRFGGMNFDHGHALPPLTGRRACPNRCCWASAAPILPGEAPISADGSRVNELVSSLKGTLDRLRFSSTPSPTTRRPGRHSRTCRQRRSAGYLHGGTGRLASTLVLVATPGPPAPIPPMSTLDAVVSALDSVIE